MSHLRQRVIADALDFAASSSASVVFVDYDARSIEETDRHDLAVMMRRRLPDAEARIEDLERFPGRVLCAISETRFEVLPLD